MAEDDLVPVVSREDTHIAYQLGKRSAKYGDGLTCPYALEPFKSSWKSGYLIGINLLMKTKRK